MHGQRMFAIHPGNDVGTAQCACASLSALELFQALMRVAGHVMYLAVTREDFFFFCNAGAQLRAVLNDAKLANSVAITTMICTVLTPPQSAIMMAAACPCVTSPAAATALLDSCLQEAVSVCCMPDDPCACRYVIHIPTIFEQGLIKRPSP